MVKQGIAKVNTNILGISELKWTGIGEFNSDDNYLIFLPFHTVHGVLKAGMLKWFAIPFSSGPCFVRTLHHDLSILGGPTGHGS